MKKSLSSICEYAKYDRRLKLYRCTQSDSAADYCTYKFGFKEESYCVMPEITRRLIEIREDDSKRL